MGERLADYTGNCAVCGMCFMKGALTDGVCMGCELEALRRRVEELKDYIRQHVGVTWPAGYRRITDEQIDAMVQGGMLNSDWELVEKLGIVRCEECGGRGFIQHLETPLEPGDPCGWTQRCPTCHGHGWVVKDE